MKSRPRIPSGYMLAIQVLCPASWSVTRTVNMPRLMNRAEPPFARILFTFTSSNLGRSNFGIHSQTFDIGSRVDQEIYWHPLTCTVLSRKVCHHSLLWSLTSLQACVEFGHKRVCQAQARGLEGFHFPITAFIWQSSVAGIPLAA